MNNTSVLNQNKTTTDYYDRTAHHDWILPVTINIVLLCATIFLLISIVHYGRKTKKWRQIQTSDSDKLNAGLVYTTLLMCAALCLLHFLASLAYLNLGFNPGEEEICDSVSDVEHCFYVLALFQVELFLWIRQWAFYSNQMFQVHFSKTIRCISFLSIFVISTFSLVALIFVIIPNDHIAKNGCKFKRDNDFLPIYVFCSISMVVVGQSVLLGLLFHALRQTNKRISKKPATSPTCATCCIPAATLDKPTPEESDEKVSPAITKSRRYRSSSSMVKRIMKKTLIFAVLSVTADIIVAVTTYYITDPVEHRELVIVMEDINAFLNLLFILLSFVQWKDIVVSPYKSYIKSDDMNRSIRSIFAHHSITDNQTCNP